MMSIRLPTAVQTPALKSKAGSLCALPAAPCCSRQSFASSSQQAAATASPVSLTRRQLRTTVRAQAAPVHDTSAAAFSTENGKLISSTEVAAFIQRDDMMDQMYRWALIEAAEGGFRNFGMPMTVEPFYQSQILWGYKVGIYKDGVKQTDLSVNFDAVITKKAEWIGRGDDGFPIMEGRVNDILGKNIEIWKLDSTPVSEDLRSTIRNFCTGLVAAMNRYYAFGSVFCDDAS